MHGLVDFHFRLHFKTTMILFDFISQLRRSAILLSRTLYLFSKLPSATNQQLFYVTEIDVGQRPLMNLWTMNHWLQYCDLHGDLVKCQIHAEECTNNLGDTFHCRLTSDIFFFNFNFPASIDNPNNIEINRLIRLVVSEMFLLP